MQIFAHSDLYFPGASFQGHACILVLYSSIHFGLLNRY